MSKNNPAFEDNFYIYLNFTRIIAHPKSEYGTTNQITHKRSK